MATLDFMALLKEEKRKAQEVAASKNKSSGHNGSNTSASTSSPIPVANARVLPSNTIDFPSFTFAPRPGINLDDLSVSSVPTISYVSSFVSRSEAMAICAMIEAVPVDHPRWTQLRGRRLQCWGGIPLRATTAAESPVKTAPTVQEVLPAWLLRLCDALVEAGVFPSSEAPNHVLINRYENGEGILGHTDGPLYKARTATLSLAMSLTTQHPSLEEEPDELSSTPPLGAVMTFQRRQPTSEVGILPAPPVACEVALLDRSLVVFAGPAYMDHLHAIADRSGSSNRDAEAEAVASPPPHSAGVFDTVGESALLANAEATGLTSGDVLWRPTVRYSLTFRHFIHLDGPQVD